MHKWYVLHALSSKEQKAKDALEERVRLAEMGDQIKEILIPTQTVQEIRGGKKKVTTRKFYPGYILIFMDLNDETWPLVNRTQGIIGFLGGDVPAPLSKREVDEMFGQIEDSKEKIAPRVTFNIGEKIKINEGPFINFIGQVENVDEERGKLGVSVNVFGRTTPVELEYWQVEKEV